MKREGQPESNATLSNGYGHIYDDLEYLQSEMHNFRDFDTAAAMIDPEWTRHNLHKWIHEGKVCMSDILVLTDEAIYGKIYTGKKMFIHINEVQRLKAEYEKMSRPNYRYCEWCGRKLFVCVKKECPDRYNSNPDNTLRDAEISQLVAGAVQRLDKRRRSGILFRKSTRKQTSTG
jgi:hypothetical protein